jgi:hypothetical protein
MACPSFSAARGKILSVSFVPNAAPQDSIFSVSFRENKHSDFVCQGRKSAHNESPIIV